MADPRALRLVVAPDKLKGSLTAAEAAEAIARGLHAALPSAEILSVPMADGGEGTVDAFVDAGWSRVRVRVRGPLGEPVDAAFAFDANRAGGPAAVIEMAAASGLALLAPTRDTAGRASTYGTGELVRAALDRGARHIVVAIGGSATTDAGSGLLSALGARLVDAHDRTLDPGGDALADIARIDLAGLDERLRGAAFEIAADVDAPLVGPRGAATVFGPQKGADAAGVERLEAALTAFANVAAGTLGNDLRSEAGTGAAGGLGFALRAFLNARSRSGVDVVAELRGLPEALRGAAYCFTGEGAIDGQTLFGKTVAGVAELARVAGARTIAFGGRVAPDAEAALAARGIVAMPIADGPQSLDAARANAAALLERAALRTARLLALREI